MLTGADGGYALELTVPVEYGAAKGPFDFSTLCIRQGFG